MKQSTRTKILTYAGLVLALAALVLVLGLASSCSKPEEPNPVDTCDQVLDCIDQALAAAEPGSRTAGSGMDAVDTTHVTNLYVEDDVAVVDDVDVGGDLDVAGDSDIEGDVEIAGLLSTGSGTPAVASVDSDAYISGTMEIAGSAYIDTNIYLDDAVWNGLVDGNLVLGTDEDAAIGWFHDAVNGDHVLIYSPAHIFPTTPATGTVQVDTGNLAVGNGTPTETLDGEDAYVEGTFEVDGTTYLDGALDADGAASFDALVTANAGITVSGDITITSAANITGDLTINPVADGGNAGAKNELIGLPRVVLAGFGQGTDGTTETTSYADDSPTGEYAPIDGDVTEAEGSGDSIYKYGASSYKASFAATAAEDDGFKRTIAGDDLEANESIGILLYSDTAISSGDLQVLLTDDGGARKFSIGAIPAGVWTWTEVDISSLAGGTGDTVTEFGITLTAQGESAQAAFVLYMDIAYKWDADDEDAIGQAIVQDGVLSVINAESGAALAELTDYFVHYESGNDFVVWISNQSAADTFALVAH